MNREQERKWMEAQGYKVYDHAGDAVGMTEEEKELLDLRITLASAVRKRREKLQLSQKVLATRLKTSQPRIAKIEQAASDVSIDQIVRAYAAMGGRIAIKELSANGDGGKRKPTVKRKVKA